MLLGNNSDTADGLRHDPMPIIVALDGDLAQIQLQRQATWALPEWLLFLSIRLRLYMFALAPPPPFESLGSQVHRDDILNISAKASGAAIELLCSLPGLMNGPPGQRLSQLGYTNAQELAQPELQHGLLSSPIGQRDIDPAYWPSFVFDGVAVAAFTLIYLAELDVIGDAVHKTTWPCLSADAAAAVRNASTFFRSMSIAEYDNFQRASEGIAYMAGVEGSPSQTDSSWKSNDNGVPRSHMCANMMSYITRKARRRWERDGWRRGDLQLAQPTSDPCSCSEVMSQSSTGEMDISLIAGGEAGEGRIQFESFLDDFCWQNLDNYF